MMKKKFLNWLLKDFISEITETIIEESAYRVGNKVDKELDPLRRQLTNIPNKVENLINLEHSKLTKELEDAVSKLKNGLKESVKAQLNVENEDVKDMYEKFKKKLF